MKRILLIVDIQKGFISNKMTEEASQRIDTLLSLELFDSIIASRYVNYPDNPIVRLMGWNDFMTNEEQHFVGATAKTHDKVVEKTRYSAVTEELLAYLEEQNHGKCPEQIYLVGVDTECCVLSTAIDLFELGIRPIVLSHYCASTGGEAYHRAGILSLHHLIGRNNIYGGQITSATDFEIVDSYVEDVALNAAEIPTRESKLVDWLIAHGKHISFAESCTGGMAAAELVNVPAASKVFHASVVTYANEAKIKYLGVKDSTIAAYGVVSEEVAAEMAQGVAENNGAQIGVGISGIAGPGGATATKPVGMVCFGFFIDGKIHTSTMQFGNRGRNDVRRLAVDYVYDSLNKLLCQEA